LLAAPAQNAQPGDLVAAYAFDEGSGTTVTDASGNTVGSYPGGRTNLRIVLAHCSARLCVRSEIRIG
jgi:hypothetical protein